MDTRMRIGMWAASAALILFSNALPHEAGSLNWSGLISYAGGLLGGCAWFYPRPVQS